MNPSSAGPLFRLLFLAIVSTASALDVPRWQPHDFSFTAKADVANPFMVPFSATAKGPGGVELKVAGFDGEGTWKVRVGNRVGTADIPALTAKAAEDLEIVRTWNRGTPPLPKRK